MSVARKVALAVFGPIVIYLGGAIAGALLPSLQDEVGPQTDDAWIVLVDGAIHYDILLPLNDDTRRDFAFLADAGVPINDFNATWLSVGWGSEAFYTTAGSYSDVTLGAVARAITGDTGVMRFEVYGGLPDIPELKRVPVSRFQLDAMRMKIRADLADAPVALPLAGYSATDAFYAARGRFHIFNTCNVWVGDILSGSGLAFGAWTPTPFSVRLSLWWNGLLVTPTD